jgi:hypothetical protein
MRRRIKKTIEILTSMEVGHVYAKKTLIRMVDPDALKIEDEELNRCEMRSFDVTLCRAKARIMFAHYRTNINKQIERIL